MKNAKNAAAHWDDGLVWRRRNMFWEQEYFPGQNAAANLAASFGKPI